MFVWTQNVRAINKNHLANDSYKEYTMVFNRFYQIYKAKMS